MSWKTAFVFPGQGSLRVGMLEQLPESDDLARLLDAAEALADLDLRATAMMGPESELADTRNAQPLLYLADWCWAQAMIETGVRPEVVAGHSLGELAALAVAGVYSVEAGLELVVERSKLMATAAAVTPGAMSAVLGMQRDAIARTIDAIEGVWVANDNSAGQVVISGTREGVERAVQELADAGARKVVPLNVAGPFHSPLMEPARLAFEELVLGAAFHDAAVPVIQNTEPVPTTDAETIRRRLIGQITAPVRWTETIAVLAAAAPLTVVEAGPGSVLTGLMRRTEGITAISVEASGLEAVLEEVQ
jgi:[acyl-carrier-protein] S-malonyltransferase